MVPFGQRCLGRRADKLVWRDTLVGEAPGFGIDILELFCGGYNKLFLLAQRKCLWRSSQSLTRKEEQRWIIGCTELLSQAVSLLYASFLECVGASGFRPPGSPPLHEQLHLPWGPQHLTHMIGGRSLCGPFSSYWLVASCSGIVVCFWFTNKVS